MAPDLLTGRLSLDADSDGVEDKVEDAYLSGYVMAKAQEMAQAAGVWLPFPPRMSWRPHYLVQLAVPSQADAQAIFAVGASFGVGTQDPVGTATGKTQEYAEVAAYDDKIAKLQQELHVMRKQQESDVAAICGEMQDLWADITKTFGDMLKEEMWASEQWITVAGDHRCQEDHRTGGKNAFNNPNSLSQVPGDKDDAMMDTADTPPGSATQGKG
ncbi:hypothetical protein BJ742DRAFT_772653 [Cladochytrium replicatum]|nr:hypothetical protein BJ742DRAFT_772653 [Cladochytrium replicatum]